MSDYRHKIHQVIRCLDSISGIGKCDCPQNILESGQHNNPLFGLDECEADQFDGVWEYYLDHGIIAETEEVEANYWLTQDVEGMGILAAMRMASWIDDCGSWETIGLSWEMGFWDDNRLFLTYDYQLKIMDKYDLENIVRMGLLCIAWISTAVSEDDLYALMDAISELTKQDPPRGRHYLEKLGTILEDCGHSSEFYWDYKKERQAL